MSKVNLKEEEILSYISNFLCEKGYAPSIREIGAACGLSSTATVYYYLEKLEQAGHIRKSPSKNRTLELVSQTAINMSAKAKGNLPLVGKITAGIPILATESIEDYISVPTQLFKNPEELFVLTVTGTSMIDAGIYNGDFIIVRKQSTANNGDIIAALIENSATVKRFYKEGNHFRLKPENTAMQDIILDNVEILGLVVGLIRKMDR